MKDYTSITLERKNKKKLELLGVKGETWDQLLLRIISMVQKRGKKDD